jgi:hypothetical protein
MATSDYPRAWRAAAAILAGEAITDWSQLPLPQLDGAGVLHLHGVFRCIPPPLQPPLPFEPLLTYVKLRPIGFKWNAWVGRLVDSD